MTAALVSTAATAFAQTADAAQQESGADGTNGSSTGDTSAGDSGTQSTGTGTGDANTTTIETGDAQSTTDAGTQANTNDTNTNTATGTVTVENANDANADNGAASTAQTGNNAAAAEGVSILTGSASAFTNVINVINTNIFNANGLFYFLNILLGNASLDMRNMFSVLTGGTVPEGACTLSSCDLSNTSVSIANTNNAVVTNDVSATASTGGNTATASNGSASVTTGNANAAANVVNIVNTNISGANYLLLAVNNFSSFAGDVVFPGSEWFRDLFTQGTGIAAGSTTTVTNTNTASVTNNGDVVANSGDNTVSGTSAVIATGDAQSATTIVNEVNTNVFGNSLLLLFRIHGSWTGNVFGLPEGMTWRETGDGVELMLAPGSATAGAGSIGNLAVTNTNNATVTNNVSAYALTGDNEAAGTAGARITTGDAHASANILNVVNTNILGRNWILAIFNIFGDWTGNISFGQPDLWVGARTVVPNGLRGGECFTYEVTVNNLGDARATNVTIDSIFDSTQQHIEGTLTEFADRVRTRIGSIAPHASELIQIPTCLATSLAGGTNIDTRFVVKGLESEGELTNNTDLISVTTHARGGGAMRTTSTAATSTLSITKTVSQKSITASSTVDYKIFITNKGKPIYRALLVDTIYDALHKPVHEQRWGLDVIHANETLVIGYTAVFNASTTPGTYTNEAFVSGTEDDPAKSKTLGNPIDSPIAKADLEVTASPVMTETICTPIITHYLKFGEVNDTADVTKLQFFLRSQEHASNVEMTGVYDELTYNAVHNFQEKYAADVLAPWGIAQPTGFVYYTTAKKINELWCNHLFPLSATQQEEIAAFRAQVKTAERTHVPIPASKLKSVGMAPKATPAEQTAIAQAPAPVPTVPEHVAPNADLTQVAAVAQVASESATTSMWNKLKSTVSGVFSWFAK